MMHAKKRQLTWLRAHKLTMTPRNHEDLRVWHRAMDLAEATHNALETFSREYRYSYGDQFRRAAISVAANIAEGAARRHRREFVQFLSIARGSLAELHTLSRLAGRVRLCSVDQLVKLDELIDHTGRMLTRMLKALDSREPRASARRHTDNQ
ncbi:MAG TPA: four helix bundle protein [Gemmatimonadaceae bacterium]